MKGATREGIAELCERIWTGFTTATNEREDQERAGTLPLALSYVEKECVGTWRSRSAEKGSRE